MRTGHVLSPTAAAAARAAAVAAGAAMAALSLVAAGPAVAAPPPTAATATTAAPGSVAVHLTTLTGSPLPLAGARLELTASGDTTQVLTTDADGEVTFAGVKPGIVHYVEVLSLPADGANTYIGGGVVRDIAVASGATTPVTIPLTLGASVTGQIVGPDAAPQAFKTMYADGVYGTGGGTYTTKTDATGHYHFEGMLSGTYDIVAYGTGGKTPAQWKTRVVQQTATARASQVALSKHFVHSNYDLQFWLTSLVSAHQLTSATVKAIDVKSGRVWTTKTSQIVDSHQLPQFDIPSGAYVVELITSASPAGPSQELWYSSTGGDAFTMSRAAATPITVTFGKTVAPSIKLGDTY